MDAILLEWGSLLLRWLHMITGICWIGSSFYFMHIDASIKPTPGIPAAGGWLVNGAASVFPSRTTVRLSAPGAVGHDVAHQVVHVVLQISDDVLDDVSDRDHAHDLARVQHW